MEMNVEIWRLLGISKPYFFLPGDKGNQAGKNTFISKPNTIYDNGKVSVMIYGGLAAIISAGFIVYDTDNLIKRYTYDVYIWVAVALYLDIINQSNAQLVMKM